MASPTPVPAPPREEIAHLEGALAGKVEWSSERPGETLSLSEEACYGTDDPGSRKVIRARMSASTMHALESCPSRWAVESLLPRDDDPFAASCLGTSTHQLYEDLFQFPAEERTLVRAYEILMGLHEAHGPDEIQAPAGDDLELLGRWREEITVRMEGLWKIEDPSAVDLVATERQYDHVEIVGVPFIGFVDRMDRAANGRLKVVDYKAGLSQPKAPSARFGDSHGDQLRLYTLAVEADSGEMPVSATLYYVAHAHARSVKIDRPALDATASRFRKAWEDMNSYGEAGQFPTRASPLCGWCPLAQVCPTAAAAGKDMPRSTQAWLGPILGVGAPGVGSVATPPSSTERDQPHIEGDPMRIEDKPFVEEVNGTLNLGSYAATAAFGMVEMAVEALHEAGQPVNPETVSALSETFANVIARTQNYLDSRMNMQDALHTRLRGALHTSLRTIPMPFGGDENSWDTWAARTVKRLLSIATAAEALWQSERNLDARPWAALAVKPAEAPRAAA